MLSSQMSGIKLRWSLGSPADTPDCKWAAETCIKVSLMKFVSVLRRQKVLPAIQEDSLHFTQPRLPAAVA